MSEHLHSFGLGVKTGVDLPREYSGVVPNKAWKRKRFNQPWYLGETVIAAIGQGYNLVTPLQVTRYTSLLATGYLVTPQIASVINGNKIKNEIVPIEFDKFIYDVRKGMYDVCNVPGGTGYRVMHNLPIVVAGKTGTSQVTSIPQSTVNRLKEHELAYFHRSHAWFTSYAPYDNPQFIVAVLIEHGGHGGSTSAPIAADIYKWLFAHRYFDKKPVILVADNNLSRENNGTIKNMDVYTEKEIRKVKPKRKKIKVTPSSLDLF